jgi:prepilin-type N-terminal cleavage/methylation domain-containing protein
MIIIKKNRKTNRGFSLLELLVVVGILGILLTFGISSYNTAQKRSRDAKRRGDIKDLQKAAEQYYSICNYSYPANLGTSSIVCTNPTNQIMPTNRLPHDPKTGSAYSCIGCSTSGFTICATPEIENQICVYSQQ